MSKKLDTVGYGIESEAVYKGEHLCLPEISPKEAEALRKELDETLAQIEKGKRAVETKVRRNIAPSNREVVLEEMRQLQKAKWANTDR